MPAKPESRGPNPGRRLAIAILLAGLFAAAIAGLWLTARAPAPQFILVSVDTTNHQQLVTFRLNPPSWTPQWAFLLKEPTDPTGPWATPGNYVRPWAADQQKLSFLPSTAGTFRILYTPTSPSHCLRIQASRPAVTPAVLAYNLRLAFAARAPRLLFVPALQMATITSPAITNVPVPPSLEGERGDMDGDG